MNLELLDLKPKRGEDDSQGIGEQIKLKVLYCPHTRVTLN